MYRDIKLWGVIIFLLFIGIVQGVEQASSKNLFLDDPLVKSSFQSPYGTGQAWYDTMDFRITRDAGAKFIRVNFAWNSIEPIQGEWNFGPSYNYGLGIDTLVDRAEAYNIHILALLAYTPRWASTAPPDSYDYWAYPPANMNDYATFVDTVVKRYKDRIKYWEIWNEPNIYPFWRPSPDPVLYTELLIAGYNAAKAADSTCIVLIGGLANRNCGSEIIDYEFLQGVYDAGGKDYFDIMVVHPYSQPRSPDSISGGGTLKERLDSLKNFVVANGDSSKKIWLTEIGWPNSGPQAVSEVKQAEYLTRTFEICLEEVNFVEKVFWYQVRDNWPWGDGNFGIVREDLSLKPSYFAYQSITSYVTVALISPNGGETWEGGSIHDITWSCDNPDGVDHYRLLYSIDGGATFSDTIAHSIPSMDTSYSWTLPTISSSTVRVKVQALYPGNALRHEDTSDENFTIVEVGTEESVSPPRVYRLFEVLPNPFSQITEIRYQIPADNNIEHVRLDIFDASGRLIRNLVNEGHKAGYYQVTWDGKNANNQSVSAGVYFYRLTAGNYKAEEKMILIR